MAAGPPLLVILLVFFTPGGKRLLDGIDLKWATLLHSVRMLVEITLYFLWVYRQVPGLMTIEGGNVDFIAGLTAPIIWRAYSRGRIGKTGLLVWNFICLASVLNAVVLFAHVAVIRKLMRQKEL